MKLFLVMLSFVSMSAFANDPECVTYMPCGNYEGTGNWYDVNGKTIDKGYQEKILITPIDDHSVNIKVYIYSGKMGKPWTDSTLVFDSRGQLNLIEPRDGLSHAAGYCANDVCTISFRPVEVTEKNKTFINSFVNILRFENGHLKRYNMVADSSVDGELVFQHSDLIKK